MCTYFLLVLTINTLWPSAGNDTSIVGFRVIWMSSRLSSHIGILLWYLQCPLIIKVSLRVRQDGLKVVVINLRLVCDEIMVFLLITFYAYVTEAGMRISIFHICAQECYMACVRCEFSAPDCRKKHLCVCRDLGGFICALAMLYSNSIQRTWDGESYAQVLLFDLSLAFVHRFFIG